MLLQKSSDDVRQALDQLRESGWAKRWGSQPYVSRRTVSAVSSQASMIERFVFAGCVLLSCVLLVQFLQCSSIWWLCLALIDSNWWACILKQTSLRELTTLGIKNAENLAIPSVRNDVSVVTCSTVPVFRIWNADCCSAVSRGKCSIIQS